MDLQYPEDLLLPGPDHRFMKFITGNNRGLEKAPFHFQRSGLFMNYYLI